MSKSSPDTQAMDGTRVAQGAGEFSSGEAQRCMRDQAYAVANLTFGGRSRCRLFICASHTLFAIYTNQRGAERP